MRSLQKLLLGLVACAFCLPQTAHARPVEFNLQTAFTATHVVTAYANEYSNALEKATDGQLICHVFTEGALMKSADIGAGVMNGTMDMAAILGSTITELVPLTATFSLPLIGDNAIHHTAYAHKIYDDNADVREEQNKVGKVLGSFVGDRSGFFSKVGPINSAEDLKGKRILTIGSGPNLDYIKALGGIPVHVYASEVYIALQRGLGDVYMGAIPQGVAFKLYEVVKDVTPVNMICTPNIILVNREFWDSISPENQKIMEELTAQWDIDVPKLLVAQTEKDIKTLKEAGVNVVELSPEKLAEFKALTEPAAIKMIEHYFDMYKIDKDPKEWFKYLHDVSAEVRP